MNEILFFLSMIAVFSAVVIAERIFGKSGLYAWAAFAPIMANILTAKQIALFGLDVTMGTVLFASLFLCTDIMSEKHGEREAKKAVWIATAFVGVFIVTAQVALLFLPNEFDFASEAMQSLFGTSLRISIVSLILFLLSNLLDVWLYNHLKRKSEKKMWLRNNVATIISNCAENFVFVFLAFVGTMSVTDCLMIALGTSVIEIVASVCDTPFLYIAKHKMK